MRARATPMARRLPPPGAEWRGRGRGSPFATPAAAMASSPGTLVPPSPWRSSADVEAGASPRRAPAGKPPPPLPKRRPSGDTARVRLVRARFVRIFAVATVAGLAAGGLIAAGWAAAAARSMRPPPALEVAPAAAADGGDDAATWKAAPRLGRPLLGGWRGGAGTAARHLAPPSAARALAPDARPPRPSGTGPSAGYVPPRRQAGRARRALLGRGRVGARVGGGRGAVCRARVARARRAPLRRPLGIERRPFRSLQKNLSAVFLDEVVARFGQKVAH